MKHEKGIKIYIADVSCFEDSSLFKRLLFQVSQERREKAQKCRFEKDKHLSIGAGLLFAYGLRQHGESAEKIMIRKGEYGKPFLFGTKNPLYFNLSHSGTRVMAAFDEVEIGCDVEQIREERLSVAERFFSVAERKLISEQPKGERRRQMFYRIWTKKESYIKATGMGMRMPLNEFSVPEMKGWYFWEYDLCDGYCYACCSRRSIFPKEPEIVDFRDTF